ncbi:dihydrofolate reductase family protein [Deinococcus radiomollis]|uniref:dihydrofolate reductase family protein n=1 Tax=Deinococcus radiomollis TaxID=468916 RepID=UPI0038916929
MTDASLPARKVVLTLFISLDGVTEEPSGWGGSYRSEDGRAFKEAELFSSGVLLLGRLTYQEFVAYWPDMQGTGAFADRMNGLPKLVATTTLSTPEWNAEFIVGDVPQAVKRLRVQPGQDILIYGSSTLAQTLMAQGLIDEYRLLLYPVVLGRGRKLFAEGAAPLALTLISTQPLSSGVVILTYRPTTE